MTIADYIRVSFWLGAHGVGPVERQAPTEPGRYMTYDGCAAYIGRTVRALEALVADRKIPFIKQGRKVSFDRERIDKWMDRHAHKVGL